MTTTTTKIGRMGLAHADFGFDAGTPLHTALRDMYTRISDNVNSRLLKAAALADGASADLEHGFLCALSELRVLVYTYDPGTGELTRINPATGYTIEASPNNPPTSTPTTHVRVTNGTGSPKNVALVVVQGRGAEKLDDLDDVDLTVAPEDGQALVWDAVAAQFKPGASGDASFKLQGVVDPTATIKGGYLLLPDGRELATYDGAGSASTDFGKDLAVNLDTILGGNPANATAYHLAIDLNSLGAAVVQTDTGRKVYPITEANLVLTTTTPEAANRTRYLFRGVIMSATTGTVWSGAGAKFATLAFLQQAANVPAQNPLVYTASQVVGAVGSTGQIRAGHLLSEKSFPAAARDTSKLSFWGLANALTDGYGSRSLTAPNSNTYNAGIQNEANGAAVLNGSNQYLGCGSGDNAFFKPGNTEDYFIGAWFKVTDWASGSTQCLFSNRPVAVSDEGFELSLSSGSLYMKDAESASVPNSSNVAHGIPASDGSWHHVAMRRVGLALTAFIDGKAVLQSTMASRYAPTGNSFSIGARFNTRADFANCRVDELTMIKGVALTDVEVAKLAATKLSHNKAMAASRQLWLGRHYAAGSSPVSDLAGFVLDMVDTNEVFVDLSGCDPTDRVDLMLLDTGAAGAISVPVQTPEFLLTAAIPVAGLDTNLAEAPRSLQGWQLDNDLHWQPLDLVGMVYVDAADSMKLKGDLSSLTLAVSATNPVRIVVSTTASAQAVGIATATQNGLLVPGAIPTEPNGTAAGAGYAGELSAGTDSIGTGTAHAVAGGYSFSTVATTTPTGSLAASIRRTLNKGRYLIGGSTKGGSTGGTYCSRIAQLFVGSNPISNNVAWDGATNSTNSLNIPMQPVNITADGTTVAIHESNTTNGTITAGVQELWIVRLP